MAQNNENTEQSCAAVTLCTGGCGFFGNPQFDGMCSKCYKDALKRKQATTNPPQEATGRSSPASSLSAAAALSAAASSYFNSLETGSPTVSVGKPSLENVSSSTSKSTSTNKNTTAENLVDSAATALSPLPSAPKPSGADETSDSRPQTPTSETKAKKRNRCATCKKKVGLTGFDCRCGGLFCSMHRYSDKHDCQFDYKKEGEDLIRKNNPVVIGSKVQKI